MTTFQRNPSLVKQAACDDIVRVTEQGAPVHIFCTEKMFDERIAKERSDATYEARMLDAVGRGIVDIEVGRYYTSVEDVFARADELRKRYG